MRVDIVIPAYNEEERIDGTLEQYRSRLDHADFRFLVALDGCTDATADAVARHRDRDARVVLLDLPKMGKGGVIREGFRYCDGAFVGFVDADAATPPEEFLRLLDAAARDADGAICSRWHPASVVPGRRSLKRTIASAAFAAFIRVVFRLPYTDTQCGAKVFRHEVVERVLPLLSMRGFEFDVEFLHVARGLGFKIVEVPSIWIDRSGSRVDVAADARRMLGSAMLAWAAQRVQPGSPRLERRTR
ncbi:MAG: glycosyltransferase [Actinomycetota bacterium]|nr:glycosyltransferase [Actinomycetota bacterium]